MACRNCQNSRQLKKKRNCKQKVLYIIFSQILFFREQALTSTCKKLVAKTSFLFSFLSSKSSAKVSPPPLSPLLLYSSTVQISSHRKLTQEGSAIPRWKSGRDSTWMGDRLGTPGALLLFHLSHFKHCHRFSVTKLCYTNAYLGSRIWDCSQPNFEYFPHPNDPLQSLGDYKNRSRVLLLCLKGRHNAIVLNPYHIDASLRNPTRPLWICSDST